MRIGITGAQGTGKTTLAAALAKKLNLPIVEEQVRTVAKHMGVEALRSLKGDPVRAAKFQWGCMEYQKRAEGEYPLGFVSDRTTIDNAVYWLKWHAHRWDSSKNNLYYREALGNVRNYDLIVYVPPEIEPEDDGFRSTDREYQLEIDVYIRAFLAASGTKNYITVRGSIDDRVNRVLGEVKQ